jgi:hypothetical protein
VTLQLSCSDAIGVVYCMHGNFIYVWFSDIAQNMLKTNDDDERNFKSIDGEHGTGSKKSECTPPEGAVARDGTSGYEAGLVTMENDSSASADGAGFADEAIVEETCATKRSVGSKSNGDAARRALKVALEALEALEQSIRVRSDIGQPRCP